MSITTKMREYLYNLAEWLIHYHGEDIPSLERERDRLFQEMTLDEQEYLNGLVDDIFGQWL